jgi:hypothetical protein
MQAEPDCRIRVGGKVLDVRARETLDQERQRIWDTIICKAYPYFADYQVKAWPRRIPVVALESR